MQLTNKADFLLLLYAFFFHFFRYLPGFLWDTSNVFFISSQNIYLGPNQIIGQLLGQNYFHVWEEAVEYSWKSTDVKKLEIQHAFATNYMISINHFPSVLFSFFVNWQEKDRLFNFFFSFFLPNFLFIF